MCWRALNSNIFRIREIKNRNYQYEVNVYQITILARSVHVLKLELF